VDCVIGQACADDFAKCSDKVLKCGSSQRTERTGTVLVTSIARLTEGAVMAVASLALMMVC